MSRSMKTLFSVKDDDVENEGFGISTIGVIEEHDSKGRFVARWLQTHENGMYATVQLTPQVIRGLVGFLASIMEKDD